MAYAVFGGEACTVISGDDGGVPEWFVIHGVGLAEQTQDIFRTHEIFVMVGGKMARGDSGIVNFVIPGVFESYGKS